jgi:HEAT repeat protein
VRKRYRTLLVVLLVAVVGGVMWQVLRPRETEPVYNGKPLSVWLAGYTAPSSNGVRHIQADDAVSHIETNAIPALLKMLRAKDSAFTHSVLRLARKQHFITIRYVSDVEQNLQALFAFKKLSASARVAVPAMAEILNQNISESSQRATATALGLIGPSAGQAVPALLKAMNNTNHLTRNAYIHVLGQIHAEPGLVVPAVMKSLHDSDATVRSSAAETLGRFGADAKAAVPALIELLEGQDANLSWAAAKALKKIDPEAAAKAGVK